MRFSLLAKILLFELLSAKVSQASPQFSWVLQANGGLLIVASNASNSGYQCSASWTVEGDQFDQTKSFPFNVSFFVRAAAQNEKLVVGGGIAATNPRLVEGPFISCGGSAQNIFHGRPHFNDPKLGNFVLADETGQNGANWQRNPGRILPGIPTVPSENPMIRNWIWSCSADYDKSCSTNWVMVAEAPAGWSFCTADVELSQNHNAQLIETRLSPQDVSAWMEVRGSTNPFDRWGGSGEMRLDLSKTTIVPTLDSQDQRKKLGCTIPVPAQNVPISNPQVTDVPPSESGYGSTALAGCPQPQTGPCIK